MRDLEVTEQREYANTFLARIDAHERFAEQRSSQLGDEFARLEVQIATVILAFSGIFFGAFYETVTISLSDNLINVAKVLYVVAILFVVLSLIMGLIHIKRKQMFWEEIMNQRIQILQSWKRFLLGKKNFAETLAFHEGISASNNEVISTPKWTWIFQTISLGVSFSAFFILLILLLF